jgi:hypothetical protein
VVVSTLPGDFVELMGQPVEVKARGWWQRPFIGRVVSVDATRVTIDTGDEVQVLPVSSTLIVSRTPERDRKRMVIVTVAAAIGLRVILGLTCRNGACS